MRDDFTLWRREMADWFALIAEHEMALNKFGIENDDSYQRCRAWLWATNRLTADPPKANR